MKFKNIIIFSILFAFIFSMMHSFAFVALDKHQCSVSEFVDEMQAPVDCGDLCDTHFKYHQAYIFPITNIPILKIEKISNLLIKKESYNKKITQDLIIPPTV